MLACVCVSWFWNMSRVLIIPIVLPFFVFRVQGFAVFLLLLALLCMIVSFIVCVLLLDVCFF